MKNNLLGKHAKSNWRSDDFGSRYKRIRRAQKKNAMNRYLKDMAKE